VSRLKKTPEPLGQNARWLEQLGEITFTVQHRKGTSHANADAISRHPCLNKPSCTACHPEKETAQLTARRVHVRVTSDPEQTVEGRNDCSDAAGGGAADHPTQNSDQLQHLTVVSGEEPHCSDSRKSACRPGILSLGYARSASDGQRAGVPFRPLQRSLQAARSG